MTTAFPRILLSDTEEAIVAELITHPAMQKYLNLLAYTIAKDIVTAIPEASEPSDSWLRKEIFLKGQISNIETLLSIQPRTKQG